MAFDPKNLASHSAGPGPNLWSYRTADAAAAVDTAGYFNDASEQLNIGDFIFAYCGVGGTPEHGIFVVLSNASGVVDVGDMTALGSTDTD